MMGHRNLSKSFALTAALLMALCAFAVFAVDNSDADNTSVNDVDYWGFKQDKSGTIAITVHCEYADTITITATENSVVKAVSDPISVDANSDKVIKLSFKLSKGEHDITLVGHSEVDHADFIIPPVTIVSGDNIWSHVTSYIVLIIVVIVVIIIAVLYIRAKPNNKPTTTFTQLEEEKKAARAESKPSAPAKTEKVKYTSSRRK